jgi:NAD(P)-dependent dehydrogenase (short-subunit alcohol dehydrogenase family)
MQNVALVTGATNGIGKVTALELARAGYRVLLTSRDQSKGQRVVEELRSQSGNDALELFVGDLSNMSDVQRIALEVRAQHPKLDVLVNNAGGLFTKRTTTVDGLETTFAFNHLSYFLLTNLLLPSLRAAGNARVVSVSSVANRLARMRWDDLEFRRGYSGYAAYNQSKLMNVLFSNALARRLRGTGVTSNVLHPGAVRSGFNYNPGGLIQIVFSVTKLFLITPEQGARTSLHLAISPEVAGVTGGYFANKKQRRANPIGYEEDAQERLWGVSEQLLSTWLNPVENTQLDARV